MNKNLYRIVFNKARNMFMAVAENVRSQSKAAGQSTSLRGYGATGKPVTLVVNMNTKISETVKNSILSNKGTIQRFDPIKNTLHSY